ncbi:MAG: glutamine amidotransferase-related protein [Pseudomonadales bacterium]
MNIGVLVADEVRSELAPRFGQYPTMFESLLRSVDPSIDVHGYAVHRGEYPQDIDAVDAYIISGSRFSAYDDEPWIHRFSEFVKHLHERRKKLVGICFGHQLIAHALGGRTEKSAKGWGIGVQTLQLSAQAYGEKTEQFQLLANHQDQVVEPVPGSTVLAGNEFCPIGMYSIDEHILAFQGHPEFSPAFAREFYKLRREQYGEQPYQTAIASLEVPADNKIVACWIVDFIQHKLY